MMTVRVSRLRTLIGELPLIWASAIGLLAQTTDPANDLSDADNAIAGLRETTRQLSDAVRHFRLHLDEALATYDRGQFLGNTKTDGADAGITSGPVDILQTTIRKCMAFRMLATRNERYQPAPLVDLDQIQSLILQARKRANDSTAVLRRLLLVSVKNIDPHRDSKVKARHNDLLKARTAAEDAAAEAYLALPVDAPPETSKVERRQKAWDLLVSGSPRNPPSPIREGAPPENPPKPESVLPIHIDRHKRYTMGSDPWYRMAITDSGRSDAKGRRLFFQEEWIQRGQCVIRTRRRVAVDTTTGAHILVKRYSPVELQGSIDELYARVEIDSLWYMDPVDDNVRPPLKQVESALAEFAGSRDSVDAAARDFMAVVRDALGRHDRQSVADGKTPLDAGLSDPLREHLFAIRAHLAGVPTILDAERRVRHSIAMSSESVGNLESLAAWANRIAEDDPAASQWEKLLQRCDHELAFLRTASVQALISLPPETPNTLDKFPALQEGLIVRIRRLSPWTKHDGSIRFHQEIWRLETKMPGQNAVRRTATLVEVDPATGDQIRTSAKTKYYDAGPGNAVEEIFDEYGSDELLISER